VVDAGVYLYWIPLGAGAHVVRVSGKVFEALSAVVQRRQTCDLYHSALEVVGPGGTCVIEMTPIPGGEAGDRGVVAEWPVGMGVLGRVRLFRYEIRRWSGGVIPDASSAVEVAKVAADGAKAQRVLALAPSVPPLVWGRDELGAGDMWNSNSVTSWLLASAGVDLSGVQPPAGGRAPGWHAGLVAAGRGAGGGQQRAA
jgi:hypothetical protein